MCLNKTCGNCKYWRDPDMLPTMNKKWCSSSLSDNHLTYTLEDDMCDEFYKRGKKAPLWMRLINKVMK